MLADLPRNWGRWGEDDQIGCLNYQTAEEVLRGVREVKSGKIFTLGLPIGSPRDDPVWPGRSGAMRLMTQDRSHYTSGKLEPLNLLLTFAPKSPSENDVAEFLCGGRDLVEHEPGTVAWFASGSRAGATAFWAPVMWSLR